VFQSEEPAKVRRQDELSAPGTLLGIKGRETKMISQLITQEKRNEQGAPWPNSALESDC
jgi:hypothetical protein